MSLFAELKRRNVFRVGIAYSVVAWVFLQGVDFLLELIEAPGWVLQVFFLAAALGFVAALIFAWVFELTPEGVRREADIDRSQSVALHTGRKLDRVIIIFLALAVTGLLLERFRAPPKTTPSLSETTVPVDVPVVTSSAAANDGTLSLAVLPFANMSPDPDNEYFSDGISEELLNLLVRVEGLRVPSRTSSFAFKGQNRDIRDIAGQLEVEHILEGSVRKAGNQVRITAQLIDVRTDTHLWSETYDRELEDIFAIQDEIANQIVGALQGVLGDRISHERPTDNLEAYNLYLQGLYQFQQRGEALAEAERLLRGALALDPDFAEAWGILGLTLVMQPNYIDRPLDEAIPLALEAADRADSLRPNMAEALMVRGNAASKNGDYASTLALHQQAVELHPDHSLALLWYGIQLLNAGYLAEAKINLTTARQLDPVSGLILDWLGRTQIMLGDRADASDNLKRAMQFNRPQALWGLGILSFAGDLGPGQFIELAENSTQLFQESARLAVRVNAGEISNTEAEALLGEAHGTEIPPYSIFVLASYTGDTARMAEIFPVLRPRDTTIASTLWYPAFGALRNAPETKAELRRIGMVDVWRQRGWPDLCRPVGDDDFECEQ